MDNPPPIPRQAPERLGDNAGIRMLLPVGRSGFAIAAGYLGLFSVLMFPAPLALLFGVLGIWDIRRSRHGEHPKHGMGRAIFGLVMGCLFSVLLLVFLVAACVA